MPLSNGGDADADDIAASILLPAGLAFATPDAGAGSMSRVTADVIGDYLHFATDGTFTAGDWTCGLSADRLRADCELESLASGDSTELTLDLADIADDLDLGDDAWTEFSASSGDHSVTYRVRTGLSGSEPDLDHDYLASGNVAATVVGAPLLGCDLVTRDCQDVMGFRGSDANSKYDNNSQKMRPLNLADGETSSATTVLGTDQLPEGATVLNATLTWSANRGAFDTWTGELGQARLRAPGGEYVDVSAESVETSWHLLDQYYQATIDITDVVAAGGNGEYSLADIALPRHYLSVLPNYYAGFAITVVYEHEDLPEASVVVLDGTHWLYDATATLPFHTEGAATVDLGLVAFEGDRGKHDNRLAIDGATLQPWGWSGTMPIGGNPGNVADSTAFGSPFANSLGTDAKMLKTHRVTGGDHTIELSSGGEDAILFSSIVVTVTPADTSAE